MKNYVNYRDKGQTEKRVQITQATCNNKKDIEKAIEKSKKDLKKSDVPSGYKKLDEEIVTTVYKVPGKTRHKTFYSNINEINKQNLSKKFEPKKYEKNKNFRTFNTEKKRYFYNQSESPPNYNDRYDSISE